MAGAAQSAAAVIKSFSLAVQPDGSLSAGLDVDPDLGRGNSGSLGDDLADVFQAIGEAAAEQGRGVVFLFDEIQFLERAELEGLIGAVHRTVQRQLPITFAGAGLPQLPGLAGTAKSYAERLFKFPSIGGLVGEAAVQALVEPARGEGVAFTDEAVERILTYTEGYPYFIQEYGRAVWNVAEHSPITGIDADDALALGRSRTRRELLPGTCSTSHPGGVALHASHGGAWHAGAENLRRRGGPRTHL